MKICSKCKKEKLISEFHKNKSKKDGFSIWCKDCNLTDSVNRQKKYIKEYEQNIQDSYKYLESKFCSICKTEKSIKEFGKDSHQKTGLKNHCLDCDRRQQQNIYNNDIEKNREKARKRMEKRLKKPKNKLYNVTRVRIYKFLKENKGGRNWPEFLPYTFKQYCKNLEKQFKEGMSWNNYGQWHVDHKIPISVFNFSKPTDIDFKLCWALSNLQPMWAKDNLIKHNKITKPFQPSFAF